MIARAFLAALLLGAGCDAAPGLRVRGAGEPAIQPKPLHIAEESEIAPFKEATDPLPPPTPIPFTREVFPIANFTSLPPYEGAIAASRRRARAAGGEEEEEEDESLLPRDINGADDRKLYTGPAELPYSAMGRLLSRNGFVCSATLVGPRHVASARHCYQAGVGLRFQPLYDRGERLDGAFVTAAISKKGEVAQMCDHKDDWVVFVIDQRLGQQYGWLGFRTLNSDIAGKSSWWNFGYPTDLGSGERPYYQGPFAADLLPTLQCQNGGPLTSDMDAASGQSGGPLWVNQPDGAYMVGMHSASQPGFSVAAHGSEWFDALSYARANYP
ncbi:hypothetical protein GGTG_03343 [Gaeumannomyces tritici R3-111a-1]|uniref:Peptidase S1 domain-containing protein n=1 Tax=Gaeumannomyces tritici (strain R3-111a-1) TaxID=644352 RepID=J3NPY5_GAET3|nr:hypothetical protein GGTG_03343 [Gaeumannomyces tritici R3-111a-1]EJT78241.1 hypothetical protein GGTG_03343 [Gaeumannomyces tritici R3-111a-1]